MLQSALKNPAFVKNQSLLQLAQANMIVLNVTFNSAALDDACAISHTSAAGGAAAVELLPSYGFRACHP